MESGSLVRAIDRAAAMLSSFSAQRPELSLTELAKATGIAPSSAHRILASLAENDLIERSPDGRLYRLGARAAAIGAAAQLHSAPPRIQDLLDSLRDETSESVGLSRRLGDDATVIARAQSRLPIAANVQVGTLFPGHATSAGRVLLAGRPREEIDKLFRNTEMVRYTPNTPANAQELLPLLDEARSRGYAVERDSFVPGLTCIAVPVPVTSGIPTHAVGISASSARWDESSIATLASGLNATAAAVARILAEDFHPN